MQLPRLYISHVLSVYNNNNQSLIISNFLFLCLNAIRVCLLELHLLHIF